MSKVSVEFLESYGFQEKPFSDGKFWIKMYTADHYLQVDPELKVFTEDNGGWVEHLTEQEFVDTVVNNAIAINQ